MKNNNSKATFAPNRYASGIFYVSALLIALLYALSGISWASTAVDDRYTISNAQGTETLAVTYNDRIDISTPELIVLAGLVGVGNLSDPAAGSVKLDTDDELIYAVNFTPNPNFTGTVSFDYFLRDARGDSSATVTLNIISELPELTVIGDSFKSSGEPIIIYPLENDTLLPGKIPLITFSEPGIGTVISEGSSLGVLLYTPPPGIDEITETSLTYTVAYEGVGSATGTINITIDPGLDPIRNGIVDDDQQDLAQVLQTACDVNSLTAKPDEVFTATCNELINLGADQRSKALEDILLRQVGAQSASLKDQVASQINLVSSRLQSLRAGATGISFAGLGATLTGEHVALGDIIDSYVSGAGAGDGASGGRLGAFVTGTIELGEGEARGKESGFDYDSQQILIGADYRFSSKFVMGAAVGFDNTRTEESASDTKLDKDGVTFSLYGNYYPAEHWYIDWLLGYGQSSVDTRRSVDIGSITSVSTGSTDGSHSSAALGVGYTYQLDAWSMDGYVNLDYRTVVVDGYDEENDAGLALIISETTTDTFTGHLGARISRALSLDFGVLIPQLELEVVNDFRNEAPVLEASLKSLPEAGTFTLRNEDPDDSYYNAGLSLTTIFKNGFSGFISYHSNFAKDDVSVETWQAGARMELGGPSQDIELFSSRADQGVGAGLFVGTTGLGIAVTLPVNNEYVSVRGIITTLDYDTDRDLDDINYDINLDLRTAGVLLDWHPFGGGFRFSGGFFALKNDFVGRATPTENVDIGNSTFTPEEVGTLTADVGYNKSFSPYAGIGWGNAVAPASNWSISADFGVMFTDNPEVELSASSPLADANPALKAQLLVELENEENRVNKEDLADVKYWPVLTLGVSYQF